MQIQVKQWCQQQWNKPASFQSEALGWSWECVFRKLGCVRGHHDKSVFSYEAQGEAWRQERNIERLAFLPFLGRQKQPNLLPECLGSDVYSGLARTNTGNLMSLRCIHRPPLISLQMLSKSSRSVWTTNGRGRCEQRTGGGRGQILSEASSEIAWKAPGGDDNGQRACSPVKVHLSPQTPQWHNTAGPVPDTIWYDRLWSVSAVTFFCAFHGAC